MIDLAGHPALIPVGGLFLAVVGAAVCIGAFVPHMRRALLWVGLALGAAAATLMGMRTSLSSPPTTIQLASLGVAVAAEVAAFILLMPRLYRIGPRAVAAGTLAIVGGHFFLMAPAFGPWIVVLGVLCVLNSAGLWLSPRYSVEGAWLVDGLLKMVVGTAMILG